MPRLTVVVVVFAVSCQPAAPPPDEPVIIANLPAGAGLEELATLCSRCHPLPDPRVHSPEDWLTVLLRMERNMERMNVVPGTPAETAAIVIYLQQVSAGS